MANKTKSKEQAPVKPSRLRRFTWFLVKLTLVVVLALAGYTLYLDAKVVDKFEGQRWQVPVQVFGKVHRFAVGDTIHLAQLKSELSLMNYKRVNRVSSPGQFALSKSRIIIFRRAFDFGEGVEYPEKIQIDVVNQGDIQSVAKIYRDDQATEQVALEPYLIDRIVPENKEDRVLVPLQSVPERLLDTLLLVEDRDFYHHAGISPVGIARALFANLKAGRTVQGGSTLTQQLVKNMYLTRDKTIWRKANEAIIALLLEYRYSKDQLLEAYINEVYLGQHYANGIYGFGLAAEFYFGKNVSQLTDEQMATLVGVIKGPSYYDPWRYPDRVKKRRDLVLKLMFDHEQMTKSEYLLSLDEPLSVRKSRRLPKNKHRFPAYLQLVKRELSQLLTPELQGAGIRVFTEFSLHAQVTAETTINKTMSDLAKSHSKDLEVGMVVSDKQSGAVKAIIGGKKKGYAGFNRALNAVRPIGSLTKPAIYLLALERYQEYQLATLLSDKKITFTSDSGNTWQPKNYDGKYLGSASLLDSLAGSRNIPTVNLGMALGLEHIADVFHLLGYQEDITLRPSLLLGAINMSPYQVNNFYLPMINGGHAVESFAVDKILTAQGEVLYEHYSEPNAYFSEQATYLLDYGLTQVTRTGTAKSLNWRLKGKTLAGKTGTTNDQRDSWFVGYDNAHLVTTWVGRDDNKATEVTGSSGALVVFADFMRAFGVINKRVSIPENIEDISFELSTGKPVAQECKDNIKLPAVNRDLTWQFECNQPVEVEKKKSWLERLFSE